MADPFPLEKSGGCKMKKLFLLALVLSVATLGVPVLAHGKRGGTGDFDAFEGAVLSIREDTPQPTFQLVQSQKASLLAEGPFAT
jgi:hypothetical protein